MQAVFAGVASDWDSVWQPLRISKATSVVIMVRVTFLIGLISQLPIGTTTRGEFAG